MKINIVCLGLIGNLAYELLIVIGNAYAQIIPDNTLPVNSRVTTGCQTCTIEGGTERGVNLYHSFQEFSVPTGGTAYFNNGAQIQNILTRVTGTTLSNIDGLIRTNGNANLFLLNPNGISFGANASLQINGSFYATTANGFRFTDGSEFNITQPPPLLTLSVAPGLQTTTIPQGSRLSNQGNLNAGQDLVLTAGELNLQGNLVAGRNLNLIAQNSLQAKDSTIAPLIMRAGGNLLVQGNQNVEIEAFEQPNSGLFAGGDLRLRSENTINGSSKYFVGGNFRVEKLDGVLGRWYSRYTTTIRANGDVSFDSFDANANVRNDTISPGTSLQILAGGNVEADFIFVSGKFGVEEGAVENLTLSNGSSLPVRSQTEPTVDIRAGANISIGTIESAASNGTVVLTNQYQPNSNLTGGDIKIGSIINPGGTIILDARNNINTMLRSSPSSNISTSSISTSSAQPGNITLIAGNTIALEVPGVVDTSLLENIAGNITTAKGGDIRIEAKSFQAQNGAQLKANTSAPGNAGNISIVAESVSFDGDFKQVTSDGAGIQSSDAFIQRSGAFSAVLPNTSQPPIPTGNGGNIDIMTKTLSITNGARLSTSTERNRAIGNGGDAGNIKISADSIRLDGAGNVLQLAQDQESSQVRLTTLAQEPSSGIFSIVERGAIGNGGNIDVTTRRLSVTGGGRLSAVTYGQGNAGNIVINASEAAVFDGVGESPVSIATVGEMGYGWGGLTNSDELRFPYSGAFSSVRDTAEVTNGVRGSVTVNTSFLSVTNGARLTSSSAGKGDAGSVIVNADRAYFSGAGRNAKSPGAANPDEFPGGINIFTQKQGNGGTVNINARSLTVNDGIVIGALTRGVGDAGKVNIRTTDSASFDNSFVISEVQSQGIGQGGDVTIATGALSLSNGAQLRASTSGQGDAGRITIRNAQTVNLASNSRISTAANLGAIGNGNNISIQTGQLSLTGNSQITTSTATSGNAGDVEITANTFDASTQTRTATTTSSSALFDNSFVISEVQSQGIGQGGDVTIATGALSLSNGAQLRASTSGQGDAGRITIREAQVVNLASNSSISTAANLGAIGNGNNISIQTGQLSLTGNSQITTSTATSGNAGDVEITANTFDASNQGRMVTTTSNSALFDNSFVISEVQSQGIGQGGNVTIATGALSLSNGAQLRASTSGQGDAGRITIRDAQTVNLASNSRISTAANLGAIGNGNNISIQTGQLSLTGNSQITTSTATSGNAGDVEITANTFDASNQGRMVTTTSNSALFDNSFVISEVQSQGIGQGGNVTIATGALSLSNGAQLRASTSGQGDAGRITIRNAQTVNLASNSRISTAANLGAIGKGNNVSIQTGQLSLTGNSQITTSTATSGNAGDVEITANTFDASSQGRIATTTSSNDPIRPGKAGDISLRIADRVTLADRGTALLANTTENSTGAGGRIAITANSLNMLNQAQIATNTEGRGIAGNINLNLSDRLSLADPGTIIRADTGQNSAGNGGSITIGPSLASLKAVTLNNRARIAVDSQGSGIGGNVQITTDRLTLNNNSAITAETDSSQGGDLTLKAKDITLLRGQSLLSATAGNDFAGGDGGNVTINTPFLLSVLAENSDIRANAFSGNGGRITISANQIFGLRFQPQDTKFSDITASSQLGNQGTVQLEVLDVDPSRGLQDLNLTPVDPSKLVAQTCNSNRRVVEGESRFVILGRGGLSASPDDPFSGNGILPDLGSQIVHSTVVSSQPTTVAPNTIVEAQALVQDADGAIYLVSQADSANFDRFSSQIQCQQQ